MHVELAINLVGAVINKKLEYICADIYISHFTCFGLGDIRMKRAFYKG